MPRQSQATPPAQDLPTPPITNVPPPNFGGGIGNEYIWQQLAEIQKCLGKLEQSGQTTSNTVDRLDANITSKLTSVEKELAEIKQIRHTTKAIVWIVGVVGTVLIGAAGWISAQLWEVVKPAAKQVMFQAVQPTQSVPPKK